MIKMIMMMITIRACMLKRTRKKKSTKNVSRLLEREVKRLWNGKEVVLIPIVIGALVGTVSKIFHLFERRYRKPVHREQQESLWIRN